jgi:hypothetical protein
MDQLTTLLGFVATLSVATERITETIKGLPFLSPWLAVEKQSGSKAEEFRKAWIHILAIAVGTGLAYLTLGQLPGAGVSFVSVQNAQPPNLTMCFVFGAMASGGSGLWNSALDIAREVNRQKQLVTERLKPRPLASPTGAPGVPSGHIS